MASHPNLGTLCIVENYHGTNMNVVITQDVNHTDLEEGGSAAGDQGLVDHPRLMKHLSIMGEDSPLLNPHAIGMKRNKSSTSSCCAFWKWYSFQIEDRPLVTKAITAGILVGLGSFASQCLPTFYQNGLTSSSINWYQIWEFCLMGVLLQAPVTHYYYLFLDDFLPPTPSPWTSVTLIKLLIDQLVFAPSFLAGVFVFLDVMDGKSIEGIWQHLVSDWCSTIVANWKLWVPATFINLAFCPPCYRVLFSNITFFVWSIILSTLMHHDPTISSSAVTTSSNES
jgi:Mpv17 / PMP22 family.